MFNKKKTYFTKSKQTTVQSADAVMTCRIKVSFSCNRMFWWTKASLLHTVLEIGSIVLGWSQGT